MQRQRARRAQQRTCLQAIASHVNTHNRRLLCKGAVQGRFVIHAFAGSG